MTEVQPEAPFIRSRERVLFIGDSITDALRQPSQENLAYRLGSGYAMMVAAHLMAARPADDLRFKNRGVSGDGLADLKARWQTDCLELTPTVLSILIGVNDALHFVREKRGAAPAQWANDYRSLLVRTRASLPETRFVLCEPFALECGEVAPEVIADLRERQALLREIAADFDTVLVPLGEVFHSAAATPAPEYWLYDGIHPTAAGHWILAGAWLDAVGELAAESE